MYQWNVRSAERLQYLNEFCVGTPSTKSCVSVSVKRTSTVFPVSSVNVPSVLGIVLNMLVSHFIVPPSLPGASTHGQN